MTSPAAQSDSAPFDAVALYIFTGLAAFGTLMATAFTEDRSFRFHGYIATAAFTAALCVMTVGMADGRFRCSPPSSAGRRCSISPTRHG
mgnify:CR=1 FL=1